MNVNEIQFLQVTWYQDSFPLEGTDRRIIEARGNKYVMNIINVRSSDFGNYSCQAENTIGKSKSHIELTGSYNIFIRRS